jgi:hypothetical protein
MRREERACQRSTCFICTVYLGANDHYDEGGACQSRDKPGMIIIMGREECEGTAFCANFTLMSLALSASNDGKPKIVHCAVYVYAILSGGFITVALVLPRWGGPLKDVHTCAGPIGTLIVDLCAESASRKRKGKEPRTTGVSNGPSHCVQWSVSPANARKPFANPNRPCVWFPGRKRTEPEALTCELYTAASEYGYGGDSSVCSTPLRRTGQRPSTTTAVGHTGID